MAGFDIHNYTPTFLDNRGIGHDALRLGYASGCRETEWKFIAKWCLGASTYLHRGALGGIW